MGDWTAFTKAMQTANAVARNSILADSTCAILINTNSSNSRVCGPSRSNGSKGSDGCSSSTAITVPKPTASLCASRGTCLFPARGPRDGLGDSASIFPSDQLVKLMSEVQYGLTSASRSVAAGLRATIDGDAG